MASIYTGGSAARVRRARSHPIHGILSAFPLALFTAALVADIAYANSANMQWANFAVWLIAGGCAAGVLAAVAGIVDALLMRRHRTSRRRRGAADLAHGLGTLAMLLLGIINGFVHSRDAWTSVVPTGLTLSVIVTLLAWITSWVGYTVRDEAVVEEVR
ncbi:Uncharacterized membrane protein [Sphingomonas gellani]|uniref:Uncharacterized membrane protein n=1 Tax=Sphingomonas gellani TaxID=1166340 RepID=A0A1H8B4B3_9SPHN|nr:DUF2231 domain-containing protein [Sphingomonas gellani]SEM77586.1 Uncharacterized membrane protein [Sphingomonas gellani]